VRALGKTIDVLLNRSSSIVDNIAQRSQPFLPSWLRLATSSSARFKSRQPHLFVRTIPYVSGDVDSDPAGVVRRRARLPGPPKVE